MKKLQQRVDSLKPYVISFRFQGGASIVDAVFKEGWHVPQSEVILSEKGEAEDLNYHMFFSQDENVGLDEILDYIERIIALNIERELKHELLKDKVKELKDIFRKNPLSKLEDMKFILTTEKLVTNMEDDDLDVTDFDINEQPVAQPKPVMEKPITQPQPEPVQQPQPAVVSEGTTEGTTEGAVDPNVRYAPNGEIIPPLTPVDNGDIEDEFKTYDLTGDDEPITKQVGNQKIDLPAKKKKPAVELAEIEAPTNIICKCGPEDVCPACESEKIGSY